MRNRLASLLISLALATPLAAQDTCPPAPDLEADKDAILSQLRIAPDPMSAQILGGALWQIYTAAPDARAQDLLDSGMRARESFDLSGARAILDDLVAYCPDYAEGYNQRAFASFLAQDFAAALTDLERVLEIDPRHVPALSGLALTLIGLERHEEGQARLREALRFNPWLSERALLTGPPETEL